MYTRSDILEVISITPAELDLFEGSGNYTDEDMQHIDNVKLESFDAEMSLSEYLAQHPEKRRLSTAGQRTNETRESYSPSGHSSFQDVIGGIRSDSIQSQALSSRLNVDTASDAAVNIIAAMAAKTIQEAAQIYPSFLEDTLNGRFSDDPEIRAMQVAALAPLAQMQEAMQADFLQQFRAIYTAPPMTKEEMYDKMGRSFQRMFRRDRSQPLSILGIEEAQPQLNAAQ